MANINGRKFYIVLQDKELRQYMNKIMNTRVARKNFLRHVGIMGENELKDEAQAIEATGNLGRSIRYVTGDYGVLIEAQAGYALEALETGAKPGTHPSPAALDKWAKKKGLNINGFALAKKIERSGTRKYRQGGPRQVSRARENMIGKLNPIIEEYIKDVYYD